MSRISERNKAVRKAWEREQRLVAEGKGTRDWTPEQQQSIIDLGVAIDDNGETFQGQHMKSVNAYPDYAGDPDNIQFLTRKEHKEAHDGNWQNPTNWYYDPVTKTKFDFGDGPIIPCPVIVLTNPIFKVQISDGNNSKNDGIDSRHRESKKTTLFEVNNDINNNITPEDNNRSTFRSRIATGFKNTKEEVTKRIEKIYNYFSDHPEIIDTIEAVGVVAESISYGINGFLSIKNNTNRNNDKIKNSHSLEVDAKSDLQTKNIVSAKENVTSTSEFNNIVSKRAENDVKSHQQRYHTRNGIIIKEKKSYHRGGKK